MKEINELTGEEAAAELAHILQVKTARRNEIMEL